MEGRITVIKREYAPISLHPGNQGYLIMWDYKPNMEDDGTGNMVEAEHGTCCCVMAPYRKPTVGLVKYFIEGYYNDETRKIIYDGFKWEGKTVYLTNENQFNYKTLYDIAYQTNGATLPVRIKVGSNEEGESYIEFKTLERLQQFYFTFVQWITERVNEGWDKKDAIDYSVFEEALKTVPDLPEDAQVLTNTL